MLHLGKVLTVATGTAALTLTQAIAVTTPAIDSLFASESMQVLATAQASPITYVPPNRGQPRQTQGTGSRGCEDTSEAIALSLLAPSNHTGLTVSARPTFYWHLENAVSVPVEFTLVEDDNPNPIYVRRFDSNDAGLTSVSLPEGRELEEGKTYRWTVSVVCNPQRRSSDVFAQSWIERVSPSATLEASLAEATTAQETARAYAREGIWYDVLSELNTDDARWEIVRSERLAAASRPE
ncbi:hypothetical protein AY599_26405 [Leptolyngbya valderiana BDU 20041]|nr:DUF928 domain-containing protein [Geitlerinema sp. CS-897]OAB62585.1 hypothetical protein AY599_26405 [Leptolyngbya valderiana BDU 20041]